MTAHYRQVERRHHPQRRQISRTIALWSTVLCWVAVCCVAPRPAAAQDLLGGDLSLEDAQVAVQRAKGPTVYPALRSVWRAWDHAHPDRVEAALRLFATDTQLSPPARAYAGALQGYARMRRGDLHDAERIMKVLGFVDQWLLVAPFDNEGKAGYEQAFEPEQQLGKPLVQGQAFAGKERPIRWRKLPNAFPYGWLNVGTVTRPEQPICAYAATFVRDAAATAARPITVWVGSGGAFKLFWNGQQVLADAAYRGHDIDRFATTVMLQPGNNAAVLKVCGESSAPIVSLRVADARGAPDARLQVSANFEDSQQLAIAKAAPKASAVSGPIQMFDKSASKASPALLEDYARYLVLTQGDDTTVHKARDLAKRAADAAPTLERLLLAGQLAEDRNQRAAWIDKAMSQRVDSTTRANRLRLAQADLARESVNWREALGFFDQVLASDPDNVDAIRGKVELLNEVGLKQSALTLLEEASARAPRSVTLLSMLASQTRATGQSSHASEIEARYSAFRFDDRSYLSSRIDLALAQRKSDQVEHWISRLLAAEPDDVWAHDTTAKALRRLGRAERAIASYQRAHELAPEDVAVLQSLSDLKGELGQRDEQRALLQQVLQLRPQAKEVREYIEHIEPEKPRPDEALAWQPTRFLKKMSLKADGHNRRTLLDLNVTTVFENGLSSKFRQVVFQPLTDAAAAAARQYAFGYESGRQRVQLRGARVFRGDGRVDEAIESGEAAANDPSIAMYTSARTFYVQFPRLEPGDVVELRYRVDDVVPQNEFADYFGEIAYLQSDDLIQHAEYVLITPKSRRFFIDHRGIPGLRTSRTESGSSTVYRFQADDVPPLVPEPDMPPWPEVLGFVHVSTFDSYATLGRWYWGLSHEQLDLDDETRKLAHTIVEGKQTTLDKVKAVYNWVIKNTRYVALEFGIYGYKPRRCVQTVARGWGDCKDKATVIVSLLRELGIDATVVILRTGLRGDLDSKIASLAPFDHAIAYVPALDLYLDGTAENTGALELPAMDLGALAIQINGGNAKVVRLPQNDPRSNVRKRDVVATLNSDGSALLSVAYEAKGTGTAEWRQRYQAQATFKERVTQDLASELGGFQLSSAKAQDLEDFDKPALITVQGTAPQLARKEGQELSLAVTPSLRLTPRYASQSRRRLPIRIPAFSTIEHSFTVKVPKGMKVTTAPLATSGQSEFGSYQVEVTEQGSQVVVRSSLSLPVRTIQPDQYAAWQAFCQRVDAAFSTRLLVGPS
jgi:tetratricopeptide (TPR) repeat protein